MEDLKKEEHTDPIIIWLIASILFHLLLILASLIFKINSIEKNQTQTKSKQQDYALLIADEPQKKLPKKVLSIPEQKKLKPHQPEQKTEEPLTALSYNIIRGRKGKDLQQIDAQAFKEMPTPEEQLNQNEVPKKLDNQKQPIPDIQSNDQKTQHQELTQEPSQIQINQSSENFNKNSVSTKFASDSSEQQAVKTQESLSSKKNQDPFAFVPQPKRIISLKDLNLGFNENFKTIGNSQNLIMLGNSFAAPEGIALKHITYYNQCGNMMQQAFATHPQVYLCSKSSGKLFYFTLTVDRQGNLINFLVRKPTGNLIFDRIFQESIQSIRLFPKVPNFIKEDPFTMNWAFIH